MAEITCGSCEAYHARHVDPEKQLAAERAGHAVSQGLCWLNPTPVARQPADCCSQHSELQKNRMLYLAALIAEALAPAPVAPAGETVAEPEAEIDPEAAAAEEH